MEVMPPAPKHTGRWFQYSLGTMFLVVTAFSCWLGYELNWIRQRHEAFDRYQIRSMDVPEIEEALQAPSGLWMFGEAGIRSIWCDNLTDEEHCKLERIFPEADIANFSGGSVPPWGPGWDTRLQQH
jgi:hypothetical protein